VILSLVVQFCNRVGSEKECAPSQHKITKKIKVNKFKIALLVRLLVSAAPVNLQSP